MADYPANSGTTFNYTSAAILANTRAPIAPELVRQIVPRALSPHHRP